MIQWDTAPHTEGSFGGHHSRHPYLQIPAFTPLPQGVEQGGGPRLLLLQGGLALRSWVQLPIVTVTRESGLRTGLLPLTKSVITASLAPTDPSTLSSGLPTCDELMSVFLLFGSRVCP